MRKSHRGDLKRIARMFDANRARRNIVRIWEEARWMDSAATYRAVRTAANCLHEAGVRDIRILDVPADGKKTAGGWIMPPEWTVRSAQLWTVDRGGRRVMLADYAKNPQNVAYLSPGTPGGRTVQGGVIACADPRHFKGLLERKFVYLTEGPGSFEISDFLAREKAAGLVVSIPNKRSDAARYLNYTMPLDSTRGCVPCFSLTPAAGTMLREMLEQDPGLVLRARVDAKRFDGFAPLLTGSVGSGEPAVYVCGHIDEIGAQDNASGVGVAIEALRVLNAVGNSKRFLPQRRKVVFFFSTEIRGIQYWLNQQAHPPRFFGGINLDMVGADPLTEAPMGIQIGFRHRPHFSTRVLTESARLADRLAGRMPRETRVNFVSDGHFGIEKLGGHVSLEQRTGDTYHSSADTPRILCKDTLKWSGATTVAYLYKMTRFDDADVMRMAGTMHKEAMRIAGTRAADRDVDLERSAIRLQTLRGALGSPAMYRDWESVEECYKAGISRTTGMWPSIENGIKLDRMIAEIRGRIVGRRRPAADSRWIRVADTLVPVALFRGFLSFEDRVTPAQMEELTAKTGMAAGWGTQMWAWMLMTYCTGRRTLTEIVDEMRGIGIDVDLGNAVKLVKYLEEQKLIRFRPVIAADALKEKLIRIGVRRGSILMVHSSMTQFGYMQGGPKMVVDVLLDLLGPRGTLAMPTHSNNVLGMPPYDPETSRSNTGTLTEYFRGLRGVVRSAHPTHSVAAYGPAAAELVEAHKPDRAPLDRAGFWGKLYDLKGDVLLMCPIRSSTIFHVGETWMGLYQPPLVAHMLDEKGRRRVLGLPNGPWHVDHFEPTMARPLMQRGIMRKTKLGESTIYLAPARAMAEISIEVNRQDPLVSLGKNGKCKCFYCLGLLKNKRRVLRPVDRVV